MQFTIDSSIFESTFPSHGPCEAIQLSIFWNNLKRKESSNLFVDDLPFPSTARACVCVCVSGLGLDSAEPPTCRPPPLLFWSVGLAYVSSRVLIGVGRAP